MPAEWARHDAVWTAWPHLEEQWAEGLDAPKAQLAAMSAAIVDGGRGARVELLVRSADAEDDARAHLGAAAAHVRMHRMAYGDTWLRDTGPIFVVGAGGGELRAQRFRFDGWGGKYVMDGDTEVAARVAAIAGIRRVDHDVVLEGGAVEVDGAGAILTTRQCLLRGNRANPGLGEKELDAFLRDALGGDRVVWLDRGLANDHTDGHIDTLARFVAPGVVVAMEPAAHDPNADALREILRDLHAAKLDVVTVPSPGAVEDASGALLPASYMNFYIANTVVVVPTYDAPADDAAAAAIAALFPTRRTVALPCKAVVVGGGGFHCCTQQQPSL